MSDLLKTGAEWLAARLQASASRTVTYRRGAATATILATIGRKLLKMADDQGGVRMQFADRDYIIPADQITVSGSQVEPQKGDQIDDDNDDDGLMRTYEVLSPGGDEPPWNWVDPGRTLVRLHCKLVAVE